MDQSLGLDAVEMERLLLVIDASLKVSRRHHFYLWAQGIVQSLLPHDLLVCVGVDRGMRRVQVERFSSVPLPEADAARLCDADNGLCLALMHGWLRLGAKPLLFDPLELDAAGLGVHARELNGLDLGFVAVHGTLAPGGGAGCTFALFRSRGARGEKLRYLLEILVPYFQVAWLRCLSNEAQSATEPAGGRNPLTTREAEILHWVQAGDSNADIAERLQISALTVKNHVQNILRKLKVQNRAQAAARGIMWDITKPPA